MANNSVNFHFSEHIGSPPSDTFSASLKLNPEFPLYPSPASDISLRSFTLGGFGQREDGLTPSPYYSMLGCPVHFRYEDLQARLVCLPIFYVRAERLKSRVSLVRPLEVDLRQWHPV